MKKTNKQTDLLIKGLLKDICENISSLFEKKLIQYTRHSPNIGLIVLEVFYENGKLEGAVSIGVPRDNGDSVVYLRELSEGNKCG